MLKIERRPSLAQQPVTPHDLYDRYGAMLLGYIVEIVKDRTVAEQYLIKIFCDLSKEFDDINWSEESMWIQLQRFAKDRLTVFIGTSTSSGSPGGIEKQTGNKHLDRLSHEQRIIFCEIYYNRKKVAEIAIELNKTEDSIRKTLKEAFAIMRNDSEN